MDFDIFLPFRIPVKNFKVIGFWQTSKSSWSYTAFGIIFHLIFVELFAVLLFGYLFIFEAFDDLIDLMSLLPTCIGLCFKSAGLIYHIDEIEELFEALQMNLVNKKFTETFKNHVRSLDKLFKAIWGPALISCLLGSVSLFLHHKLPLRMWLPFDIANNAFGFWISAFYQIIVSSTMCGASIAIDMFPFFFMGYIIEMLQQLHVRLENLKNHEVPFLEKLIAKDRRNSTVSELKLCINYQVSILKITRKFERIFSKILLMQGLMATVILCTTAFTLSRVSVRLYKLYYSFYSILSSNIRYHQLRTLQHLANC